MIDMQNISKVYATESRQDACAEGFQPEGRGRRVRAMTGPSGSGKTTFLNVAGSAGDLRGGTYRIDGVDVRNIDDNGRSRFRNQKIGFIFQSFNLIPDLDIFENVGVPLRYRRMPAAERRKRVTERAGACRALQRAPSTCRRSCPEGSSSALAYRARAGWRATRHLRRRAARATSTRGWRNRSWSCWRKSIPPARPSSW